MPVRLLIVLGYGTRPQVIKASALRRALAPSGPVYAVDTGQHYAFALNELLYQQLKVAPPDRFLEVGSAGHAEQTALVLTRMEAVLQELKPRAVVVIGDTNSTLGTALAAAKLRLPVVHVEAGLRAKDRMMAEEINRRAVDAIASLLCTPCVSATARMRAEHPDARVAETGDVSMDVLQAALPRLPAPETVVPGLTAPYIFATPAPSRSDRPSRVAPGRDRGPGRPGSAGGPRRAPANPGPTGPLGPSAARAIDDDPRGGLSREPGPDGECGGHRDRLRRAAA